MPLTRKHKPGDIRPLSHLWYRINWFGLSGRKIIEPLKKMRLRDWEGQRVGRCGYPLGDEGGGMGRKKSVGRLGGA